MQTNNALCLSLYNTYRHISRQCQLVSIFEYLGNFETNFPKILKYLDYNQIFFLMYANLVITYILNPKFQTDQQGNFLTFSFYNPIINTIHDNDQCIYA